MNSLFMIFYLGTVGASLMVLYTPNHVYSLFWLIIAFVDAAVGAFYVGAIAILFLFVIMLIQQPYNVDSQDHSHSYLQDYLRYSYFIIY